jgi:ABC-type maltose transport system permease subunit
MPILVVIFFLTFIGLYNEYVLAAVLKRRATGGVRSLASQRDPDGDTT